MNLYSSQNQEKILENSLFSLNYLKFSESQKFKSLLKTTCNLPQET